MSAIGYTPIQLYRTSTAAATPSAGNLADGELAINLTDEKLYFKNASGVVKMLASTAGALGTVSSVDVSGGTTGLTTSGGPVTTSGTITLAGTLNVANGGTGVTTSTGTGSVVLSTSPTLVTPTLGAASATSVANALGAAATPSYTFTGDTNTGLWSPTADTVAVSTGGSECVRITSSGQVGLGTATVTSRLTVQQANNTGDGTRLYASGNDSQLINRYLASSDTFSFSATFASTGAYKPITFLTSDTERLRIAADGKIGIGTTTADALLTVNTVASFGDGSVSAPSIAHKGDLDTGFWFPAVNTLATSTNGAERMRINSTGQVLVNSTTDGSAAGGRLHITGATTQTAASLRIGTDGYPGWFFSNAAGTKVGDIVINNASTAYNTSSDERLKENIADAEDAAEVIDAIRIRQFDWKSNGSHQRYGVVAQELLEVAPEAVSVPGDSEDMMGVDYSKLVPMLIKEVQSLRARVAELEGK